MATDNTIEIDWESPAKSAMRIADEAFRALSNEQYREAVKGYAALEAIRESEVIPFLVVAPVKLRGQLEADDGNLKDYFASVARLVNENEASAFVIESKAHHLVDAGKVFHIHFSQGDLDRIQSLVNELREMISSPESPFSEDHQKRLLKRLEKLQSELHKRVSDVDEVWALVADAGIALGKFGHDVKPLVDRVRELAQICWENQARAEDLPSDAPSPALLADPDED